MKMRGADIICECLLAEGVDLCFGHPGGAILPFYDGLHKYRDRIKHILVRHEQGGAHAADGYARATGKVGVCIATSGPGATNLVTGLATAHMDSVPIVAITGQVPRPLIGSDAFQEGDTTGITIPVTKHNYLVMSAADIPQTVAEAFFLARSGRPGPVLIDIPRDVQQEEANFEGYPRQVQIRGYKPPAKGHPLQIKKAAKLINESKRPLIIAGHGVIISGAHQELRACAEKAQIPVINTLLGLGNFPRNHVLSVGMMGMHGMAWANLAVGEADLIIGVGIRFDDRITGRLSDFAKKAKVVHIDVDPAEIGKNVKTDVPVVGDVKHVLEALLQEIEPNTHLPWLEQLDQWKKEHPSVRIHDEPGKLLPQQVLKVLNEFTQGNDIYVTGVGQHQMWAAQFILSSRANNFISSGGLGTMGFELPAAMGAQLGLPQDTVWCIAGDGGLQMTIQELATIAEHHVPVKIALINNMYLGMVRQWQELFYGHRFSAVEFAPSPAAPELRRAAVQNRESFWPDYVKICEGYGIPGIRVTKLGEVESALQRAKEHNGPFLIDFIVEQQENVYPMVPPGASLAETIEDPRDSKVPVASRMSGQPPMGGGV